MSKEQETSINLRTLFFQTILSIVIVLAIVFGLAYFFRKELLGFSEHFVRIFGFLGLFIGMILSDSLPAFVPPDAFLMLAITGEMDPLKTILSMSVGSIIGGTIAYYIGLYLIPRFHLGRQMVLHYEDKLLPYIRKFGFGAVVLSALTPIPYSWMAYTVGTFKMPYRLFFLGSLFRFVRISVYFYAMYIGWITGG
ncbi:YqaA family protein [Leptospira levettii]|uniref:YqaA family protein n=1 Tax=Leptospira levettii TaxID=2023178 RepID=UPI0010831A63|nr:VTT domain-containing protein [Leptospira levettii]MCW7508542.1 VTT domain-containing protein [Leptospira levettii]MCW7519632.1 VTT domain-containing protein [Leptospira levettii]TGK98071.1 DedA family protein [Leptospira levettii]TGL11977.1 DedA family protein [Leptospira levettii]